MSHYSAEFSGGVLFLVLMSREVADTWRMMFVIVTYSLGIISHVNDVIQAFCSHPLSLFLFVFCIVLKDTSLAKQERWPIYTGRKDVTADFGLLVLHNSL